MKKSIIFDMDGVLFDTESLSIESSHKAVKELNIKLTKEEEHSFIGMNSADYQRSLYNILKDDKTVNAYLEVANKNYWGAMRSKGIPIKPYAKDALDYIKMSGYKIALATSSPDFSASEKLKLAGFTDYFDVIVTGNQFDHGKPEPDIYIKACELLSTSPVDAYAVEDSYNGIKSAYRAGINVIMIPDLLPPTDEIKPMCKYIFNDLNELIKIL